MNESKRICSSCFCGSGFDTDPFDQADDWNWAKQERLAIEDQEYFEQEDDCE